MVKSRKKKQKAKKPAMRPRKTYTETQKAEAITLFKLLRNLSETSRKTGIPINTLKDWLPDGDRPADKAIVARIVGQVDEQLHAYMTEAMSIHPSAFPALSFLDHMRAICLAADKIAMLRAGLDPNTHRLQTEDTTKRPIDLTQLSGNDLNTMMKILDRAARRTDVTYPPQPGEPDYDPGLPLLAGAEQQPPPADRRETIDADDEPLTEEVTLDIPTDEPPIEEPTA